MWKKLKIMLLLLYLFLPFVLSAQSVIGLETETQMLQLKTRLENCNQKFQLCNQTLTLTLNDLTQLSPNLQKQITISQNLESKLTLSLLTQSNLQAQVNTLQTALTEQLEKSEKDRQNLNSIKTDFDEALKYEKKETSKWRTRCIWITTIAAGATIIYIAKHI